MGGPMWVMTQTRIVSSTVRRSTHRAGWIDRAILTLMTSQPCLNPVLLGSITMFFAGFGAGFGTVQASDDHFMMRTDLESMRALSRFLPGAREVPEMELKDLSRGLTRLGQEERQVEGERLAFLPGQGLIWGRRDPPAEGPEDPAPEEDLAPERDLPAQATPSLATPPEAASSHPRESAPCGQDFEALLRLDLRIDSRRQDRILNGLNAKGRAGYMGKVAISPGLVGHLVRFRARICARQARIWATFSEEGAALAAENVFEGLREFISGQLQTWGPRLMGILDRNNLFATSTRELIRRVIDSPDSRAFIDGLDPVVKGNRLVLIVDPGS